MTCSPRETSSRTTGSVGLTCPCAGRSNTRILDTATFLYDRYQICLFEIRVTSVVVSKYRTFSTNLSHYRTRPKRCWLRLTKEALSIVAHDALASDVDGGPYCGEVWLTGVLLTS